MKSPLEQIQDLEEVIRQLRKLDSLIFEGKECQAHRSCGSILAFFENKRSSIIAENVTSAKEIANAQ